MSKKAYVIIGVVIASGIVGALHVLLQSNDIAIITPANRRSAPNVSLTDTAGHQITLSNYRGRLVLVKFFDTLCKPCEAERPILNQLQRSVGGERLIVLGIAMDPEGASDVTPYLARHNVAFPIIYGDVQLAGQFGGIPAVPTALLIDQTGRIAANIVGARSKREYEKAIRHLQ